MQYNVLENSLCTVNSGIGNIPLTFSELSAIIEYGDTPVTNITTSGVLSIDFDLGLRLHVDRMEYMFENLSTISGSVDSYIDFQYKNDIFDDSYTSLPTYSSLIDNVYYTVFSGISAAPRFVRLTHTFTTITGSLYGLRLLNNDTVVDFGVSGLDSEMGMEVVRNNAAHIETIPIFNSGSTAADAYVNIEPTNTVLDQAISISLSSEGPWVYPVDESYVIANTDNWSYGIYSDSILNSANELCIPGFTDVDGYYTTKYYSAAYETKIFDKGEQDYVRVIIDRDTDDNGATVVDSTDTCSTICIRSSNVPPKTYSIYREMYTWYSSNVHYLSFKDTWLDNDVVKYINSSASFLSTDRYKGFTRFSCVFDNITGRWAGYAIADSSSDSTTSQTWLFNNSTDSDSSTLHISQNSTVATAQDFKLIDMKLDSLGGFWVYLYSKGYRTTDWCDETGYYLAYFDNTFTEKFKWYESQQYINSIAVDYSNNYLWYTNTIDNSIVKLNTLGEVVVDYKSVENTQSLGGIDVLSDGNIIYSDGTTLHKLGSDGTEYDSYDMDNVIDEYIIYLAIDPYDEDTIWVCSGNSVNRFYIGGSLRGNIDFSVALSDTVRVLPVFGGAWVTCFNVLNSSNTTVYYVSKENRRIEFTKVVAAGSPGVNEVGYTDYNYTDYLPIEIDTTWKNLSWKKVHLNNYLLSEDRYNQIQLTLFPQKFSDRYDFIDNDDLFSSNDYFTQTSTVPNRLLWGSWNQYPSTDRVYVDTINNELVISQPTIDIVDGFIQTEKRLVTGKASNNQIEVRIKYRFGDGNTGSESGNAEYIYLYGYSVDTDNAGEYIGVYLYIHPQAATNDSRMYTGMNGSWSYTNFSNNLNLYDGTIRLFGNSSNYLYGQVATSGSTSFNGTYHSGWQEAGQKWYWKIVVDKSSSELHIDNFEVLQGDNYYYTETPHVGGIYTQELIKLQNIAPNSSKNVYLKMQANQELNVASNCEADVKVRWKVPIQ